MSIKIAVVVGSIRKESINQKLAKALVKLAPADFSFDFVRINDLPAFNQDNDGNQPEPARRLKGQIEAADAVLFVTPEYNRSIPGPLKNAIDWASRPYGKSSWGGKPAGIVGASVGAIGAAIAQSHLRVVLGFLDMPTLGQPEFYLHFTDGMIAEDGSVANENTQKFLKAYVDRYTAWVRTFVKK